ncbi:RDD family protein [Flavobacterium sp.]
MQFKVSEEILATPLKRFLNFAIDMVTLSILLVIASEIYLSGATVAEKKEFMNRFLANKLLQTMVISGFTLVYYNLFEIFTARTVGKFCTGTQVVTENGGKPHYEAVMYRSLVRVIPLYWIFSIVSPTKGLQDLISKTYVVDKKKLNERMRTFSTQTEENDND